MPTSITTSSSFTERERNPYSAVPGRGKTYDNLDISSGSRPTRSNSTQERPARKFEVPPSDTTYHTRQSSTSNDTDTNLGSRRRGRSPSFSGARRSANDV